MLAPPDPATDLLATWREGLLNRLISIAIWATIIPAALVAWDAYLHNSWTHAVFTGLTVGLLFLLNRPRSASYRLRSAAGVTLIYLFGAWLLSRGAVVGMLYLLATPLMLALMLDRRWALGGVALGTATLVGLGWLMALPFPMVNGLPEDSLLRWITIGTNLLWLGVLLTLASGYLLRRLEGALAEQKQSASLLRAVTSEVPGMVFRLRLDHAKPARFLYVSDGARDVLGIGADTLLRTPAAFVARIHAEDRSQMQQQLLLAAGSGPTQRDIQLRLEPSEADTPQRWVQIHATEAEREATGVVLNGIITDITERKEAEALIQRQAYTDTLTGLPNRLALQTQLEQWLGDARETDGRVALLLLDLDRFKEINDTRGHAGGDDLLREAGIRLQLAAGPGSLVARVGGDEFVLVIKGRQAEAEAPALAQRVLDTVAQPFTVRGHIAHVTASIGTAVFPSDGADGASLLSRADQALYESKGAGRNRCSRFTATMEANAQRRIRLAQDLRQAIQLQQLSLVYQPIIDLASGRVCKAEALLRWQHPELGPVSPAEFVPIAESTGLIDSIGAWVFVTAARQVAHWRQTLDADLRVGINHSPLQFRREAGAQGGWPAQLAALGVPGDALIVEITEGLLLDHSDALAQQLRELRACGVQVALDDFGTGYSALAYLHRYELDLLKIDRSFVSGAAAGHTGRSLCRAMVALAQELGMEVVAEGVETAAQSDWLQSIGCHHAQGWLYAKGMPPAEFEAWYHRHLAKTKSVTEPLTEALAEAV